MADYQLIIIGGGLSGIAAGIRTARFGQKTLILEQHSIAGGLNSYYYRQGHLLETGLHAMTNYAPVTEKHAPLNRLFRQLKLSRRKFVTHQQKRSEIRFPGVSLCFSNDAALLAEEVFRCFPQAADRFRQLKEDIAAYDPFVRAPWRSARDYLSNALGEPLLVDMLLLPLMLYGNAEEHDMDLGQFVIMFRSVYEDGFFRPEGTIREFLGMLVDHYLSFDGELRLQSPVMEILTDGGQARGVRLASGEEITADAVLSTVGIPGTARLSGWQLPLEKYSGRMSFMETIALLPAQRVEQLSKDRTIIFYNQQQTLSYQQPGQHLDTSWGVICFPDNFQDMEAVELKQIRITHPASFPLWRQVEGKTYQQLKASWALASVAAAGEVIGAYQQDIVFQDSFTPTTIERYTGKAQGAIYGSPVKIKDGCTPFANLYLAGTDQGYLGIVGALLSGVTIVNQHLLQ